MVNRPLPQRKKGSLVVVARKLGNGNKKQGVCHLLLFSWHGSVSEGASKILKRFGLMADLPPLKKQNQPWPRHLGQLLEGLCDKESVGNETLTDLSPHHLITSQLALDSPCLPSPVPVCLFRGSNLTFMLLKVYFISPSRSI